LILRSARYNGGGRKKRTLIGTMTRISFLGGEKRKTEIRQVLNGPCKKRASELTGEVCKDDYKNIKGGQTPSEKLSL